jgi:hypothetical protein
LSAIGAVAKAAVNTISTNAMNVFLVAYISTLLVSSEKISKGWEANHSVLSETPGK